jgi:hypothetical protein
MKRYQAEKPNRFLPPSNRDLWGPCSYLWGPQPGKVETWRDNRMRRPGTRYALRKCGPRWLPLVSTYNPTKII